jgi:hypothetical protein
MARPPLLRDGYRFAKDEGKSFPGRLQKPLRHADFRVQAAIGRFPRSDSIHRDT